MRSAFFVPLIIAINIVVFVLWSTSFAAPEWMSENFLVSWTALEQERYWVLITSVFSHSLFIHILINMLVLNSFGTLLEQVLGSFLFLSFYLVAGVVSSLSHAVVSMYVMNSPDLPALGASGSIAGLILVFSLMFPKERILLFGIIPLPAIWGALAFVGLDIWGLIAQAGGGGLPIGHGAHLGGAFSGILFYFFIVRSRIRVSIYD